MPPMQKIGILTFHRCINYGSYWQARCLVDGLRARGHDAVLLDHDSRHVNWREWRCAFQPLLPARVPRSDFRLYAAKARGLLRALASVPHSPPFPLEQPETAEPKDLVIVGSDEVWNQRHPWYGGHAIFYGAGLPAPRIAAYAASFGNQDAREGLDGWLAEQLRRFESISVRDENSRRLVGSALGREPELVLDPCLQFPPAVAREAAAEPTQDPYLLVYGHSFPAWFVEAIRRRARDCGYRLLSVGYRNDWADQQRIEASPEEFVRLVARAAAVATNFFHGCVFALLTGRPFACAPSAYRFNKVRDLARAVGAAARLVNERTEDRTYARLLEAPPGKAVAERIAALRAGSDRYLRHVLA